MGEADESTMRRVAVILLGHAALADGRRVERYRLEAGPLALEVVTLGATITALEVPDHSGHQANVVLAHDKLEHYTDAGRAYFGATIGRVANRIKHGRFELDGRTYQLACNNGPNHLHGGLRGFDQHGWEVRHAGAGDAATIELARTSPAGEEAYPGALRASVTYTLHPQGELTIRYEATTDAPTLVNLTNHAYFNLRGAGHGNVLEHELWVAADTFLPVDATLAPTGELRSVGGTPFDFRRPTPIGSRLGDADPQLQFAGGYDHCMVLRAAPGEANGLRQACSLRDPDSHRRLEVWTDRPGLQFYSGNFLDGSAIGPGGQRYLRHAGLCLETQEFPDAPSHPSFSSIRLDPGQTYRAVTVWRFDVLP